MKPASSPLYASDSVGRGSTNQQEFAILKDI